MRSVRKILIIAAATASIALLAVRPVISADSQPASEPGGMGFNISKQFDDFGADVDFAGDVKRDNPKDPNGFRFACDRLVKSSGVVHLISNSDRMAMFEMKGERRKFTAKELVWDGNSNTLTMTTNAKIIQKDEKNEETLNISGETVIIEMGNEGEMRIKIRQSDQPGSPKARLKMKDSNQLGAETAS